MAPSKRNVSPRDIDSSRGGYSLTSVSRKPRLMSYILHTGVTTYSRWRQSTTRKFIDRSYAQVGHAQHYGGPL